MSQLRSNHWRRLRHPLRMTTRKGWCWGRRCVISPRGTIYEVRIPSGGGGALARPRREWELKD